VDAAALAGAATLPDGVLQAQSQAYRLASQNIVAGKILQPNELTYQSNGSSFIVKASTKVPTIFANFICHLTGGGKTIDNGGANGISNGSATDCSTMTLYAGSSAVPAARDTILVIDTSSSMNDLGNGHPIKDVQAAANDYISLIAGFNNQSVDRIGLVSFNQTASLKQGLISQVQAPNFTTLKTKVSGLSLFSGTGWNTNYYEGLKLALDELAAHGRPNAEKIVIFMTDGKPNLPAPPSYYSYSTYEPYTKCTDMVENSAAVKSLCYKSGKQTICPVLPSSVIPDSMISAAAVSCGQTYVDYMQNITNQQTDRAKTMGVTIHTIDIHVTKNQESAYQILQRLLKNPSWKPIQLDYMAQQTHGQQYEAPNYDVAKITSIYQTIAKDIHIKLSH